MKKKRVLVLSPMYPRVSDPAAGIFVHHQVQHLKDQGCEIVVVSPLPYAPKFLSKNDKRESYRKTPSETKLDGVRVVYPHYLRPPGKLFHAPSSYALFYGARKIIGKLITEFRPHILYAHTATPGGYAGLLLARRFDVPLVISLRGSDVNVYPYQDRLTFRLTERAIAKADRVTAVSCALKLAAEKIARPQREIVVVYTGCDLDKFAFNEEARRVIREKLGIPSKSIVLIFVGRILRAKGIFELFEAFQFIWQAHPNLFLIMIGDGKDAAALKGKVLQTGNGDNVFFIGVRPPGEIPGWLSAGDIFVLPSWHEGLPNVIVEAMACGRPVIANRVGGIPEVVKDGVSGILVKEGDVKAFRESITSFIEDDSKRMSMGARGRELVKKRFVWDKNAEALSKIFEEIIKGN